jgi:hypothetical protein
MELTQANYKTQQKSRNSEYKPLQGRFKRGEYQDREEDFYDQYIENQHVDDNHYPEEKPTYQKPRKKKYRGYDLSEYYPDEEETERSGIGMAPIILILIIALLMGFIIGVMLFTSGSLPSIG